ncbi:MAG: helix-hairpin-helix domain-containing protein [Gammaproteobacteria bacterium]|nr:helix-hairpin-helix domain-containing protein [Gammaproteobacteria bacterium]MDH3507660.1 helix-hairpin-helix domain-containing protein [Gammaproteobacteria bacterium]
MQSCRNLLCALIVGLVPGLVLAGPVNINTADAETLAAELAGIGPALAAAIVTDRRENGAYASAEALMRVRGIGERVIELNRENILLSDPPSSR